MATGAGGGRGNADATLESCYVFPASFAQARLWFLAQLEPASQVAYHIPLAAKLEGPLDMVLLQRAFDETTPPPTCSSWPCTTSLPTGGRRPRSSAS
jgi:hypothetical protein